MTSQVRFIRRAIGFVLACFTIGGFGLSAGGASADPPPATSPVLNPPNRVAVLGDSMSVATGINSIPSVTSPEHSWATGNNAGVNSVWNRMLALSPGATRDNRAANGARMDDIAGQAGGLSADTRLVLIQMGGNDLCRDSVNDMTPIATYRALFSEGLDIIQNRAPNALVMVSSVPDIWNLWFLRGAPNPPNPVPSSRAGTARTFWGTGLIPCVSLVQNPTSMAQADVDRRAAVRQRDIDYNAVLLDECSKRLRCRTDSGVTFDFSSNRSSLWGEILPPAEWEFVDDDISTVDHFHPSASGQAKMARASWESGWNYADNTPPTRMSQAVTPTPSGGTTSPPASVATTWTDAAGIKGIEYRLHNPNGTTGPWQSSLSTPIPPVLADDLYTYPAQHTATLSGINQSGTSYVETRAMDGNGNLSASQFTEVTVALGAPSIDSAPAALSPVRSASFTFSGAPAGATYQCRRNGGTPVNCTSPYSTPSNLTDGPHKFEVRFVHQGTPGAWGEYNWVVSATQPPAATIDSVPVGLIDSDSATIEFSGSAAGGFQCSLNSAGYSTCSSPLNLTSLPQGANTISIRQRNDAGLPGPAVSRSWSVDSIAPAAPDMSGAPTGLTRLRTASIEFAGESGAGFECSVDGGAYSPCASPGSLSSLADGAHDFRVRQTDLAGNTGPAAQATWTVDGTPPPAPTLSDAPTGTVRSTSASVALAGESGGSFECRLNGGAWTPCTSPWSSSSLGQGAQNLEARQTDAAGNVGAIAAANWSVDTVGPKLKGQPKAKAKGKAKKGKPRTYVLSTSFDPAQGTPATLEFTITPRKPGATIPAVASRTRKWAPKLTIKSKKKPTWVRVTDPIGNVSGWVRVK